MAHIIYYIFYYTIIYSYIPSTNVALVTRYIKQTITNLRRLWSIYVPNQTVGLKHHASHYSLSYQTVMFQWQLSVITKQYYIINFIQWSCSSRNAIQQVHAASSSSLTDSTVGARWHGDLDVGFHKKLPLGRHHTVVGTDDTQITNWEPLCQLEGQHCSLTSWSTDYGKHRRIHVQFTFIFPIHFLRLPTRTIHKAYYAKIVNICIFF